MSINEEKTELTILGEPLKLSFFDIENAKAIVADGKKIDFCVQDGKAIFNATIEGTLEIIH